jgi:hypothetical protein
MLKARNIKCINNQRKRKNIYSTIFAFFSLSEDSTFSKNGRISSSVTRGLDMLKGCIITSICTKEITASTNFENSNDNKRSEKTKVR